MSQDMVQKDDQEESQNIFQSMGFAGGTFITVGVVDVLGRFGPTGLVVGAIGSYFSYHYGPKCYAAMRRQYDGLDPKSKAAIQLAMSRFRRIPVEEVEESHAQPKDDTRRMVVDVSEQEDTPIVQAVCAEFAPIFPVYPENETIRLGKAIDREAVATLSDAYMEGLQLGRRVNVSVPGRRFDPHFNGLFGKGIIAAANQGFGKSILNGVVIEQAGKAGVPAIVLDHKGEYNTVKELASVNALLVGAPGSGADFILTAKETASSGEVTDPGNADEFVALVMQQRCQAVINLSSYGSRWVSRAKIVGAVGKALMDHAEAKRRVGGRLLPCLVLLDEAQLYIPQNSNLLPPEAQENKAVLSELANAYFALVSNGRSNGYTMCFATQSLTYIAKWAIKSSQIRVLGRHAEKNDLDMCEDIINANVATRAEIESFAPGVFVVFGFTPQPMIVQFDKKQSRDLSETPGIDRLREPQQQSVPSRQPVQRLPDLATLLEEDDAPITFEELCDAVFEMAMARDSDSEIMRQLDLTREEYVNIATYIKTHRSEFMGSAPTSQAGSVATSTSTSRQNERLRLVDAQEVCREVERSGEEVGKPLEVGTPAISELSERELRMATMFFDQNLGINVIMKEFFPGVTGGTPYQKGNAEIGDALRKYTQMQKRARSEVIWNTDATTL